MEQLEESLERWRYALESRAMKFSMSKSGYVRECEGDRFKSQHARGRDSEGIRLRISKVQSSRQCTKIDEEESAGRVDEC